MNALATRLDAAAQITRRRIERHKLDEAPHHTAGAVERALVPRNTSILASRSDPGRERRPVLERCRSIRSHRHRNSPVISAATVVYRNGYVWQVDMNERVRHSPGNTLVLYPVDAPVVLDEVHAVEHCQPVSVTS